MNNIEISFKVLVVVWTLSHCSTHDLKRSPSQYLLGEHHSYCESVSNWTLWPRAGDKQRQKPNPARRNSRKHGFYTQTEKLEMWVSLRDETKRFVCFETM